MQSGPRRGITLGALEFDDKKQLDFANKFCFVPGQIWNFGFGIIQLSLRPTTELYSNSNSTVKWGGFGCINFLCVSPLVSPLSKVLIRGY
jgi:hypothetical protein